MRATPPHRRHPADRHAEDGQVLVFFVLGLVVLLGAVALGIDGSRAFEERRAAQTAVDHAATAAAYASCTGSDDAASRTAGLQAANRNGYDDAEASIVVTVDPVISQANTFRAAITSTIPGTFSVVIGIDDFTIGTVATASAVDCGLGGTGPGAVFAGGDDCTGGKYGVDVSGSNNEVIGGVHSNSDAAVSGGSNDFTEATTPDVLDPWTFVGDLKAGSIGNGNEYQPGGVPPYPRDVGPTLVPWPAGWAPSDAANGAMLTAYETLADANGTSFTGKVTSIGPEDGVYYTSSAEGMDISSVTGTDRNVVLIAPNGPIKISASSKTFNPYAHDDLPRQGVLMLSGMTYSGTERCDKYTISVSGSNATWNGVMWAPGGMVEMNGSTNVAVNGSLMGWAVRLNGSDLEIRYDADLFMGDPLVLMLE
jgi:Flp pilus assembly protein TadG